MLAAELVESQVCMRGGCRLAEALEAADEGRLGEPRLSVQNTEHKDLEALATQLADSGELTLTMSDVTRRHAAKCGAPLIL